MKLLFACLFVFATAFPALACDSGISDAPCEGVGLRTVIVSTSVQLQAALDVANPGDTILLKSGIYTNVGTVCGNPFITMQRSGTKAAPIYIGAYDPTNKPKITVDFQIGCGSPVVGGQWVLVDGMDLTSTYSSGSGMRLFADHVTVRNSIAQNNKLQGMWQDGSHQLLEQNLFIGNGSQGNGVGCMGNWTEASPPVNTWDPAHCHGIYGGVVYPPDPTKCVTPHHVTIRRNLFSHNSGSGYQVYINPTLCRDPNWGRQAHDYLVENNIVEDNGYAFFLVGLAQSTIRNNTIVQRTYPTQASNRTVGFIDWFNTPATLKIYGNLFYSAITGAAPGASLYLMSNQQQVDNVLMIDRNLYFVQPDARFRGAFNAQPFQGYGPFLSKWKSVTGKDPNGFVVDLNVSSPKFANLGAGDYHMTAGSPAIDTADSNNCPATDYAGNLRTGKCDMGAFNFSGPIGPWVPDTALNPQYWHTIQP